MDPSDICDVLVMAPCFETYRMVLESENMQLDIKHTLSQVALEVRGYLISFFICHEIELLSC